jgi:hypothetical protein
VDEQAVGEERGVERRERTVFERFGAVEIALDELAVAGKAAARLSTTTPSGSAPRRESDGVNTPSQITTRSQPS